MIRRPMGVDCGVSASGDPCRGLQVSRRYHGLVGEIDVGLSAQKMAVSQRAGGRVPRMHVAAGVQQRGLAELEAD